MAITAHHDQVGIPVCCVGQDYIGHVHVARIDPPEFDVKSVAREVLRDIGALDFVSLVLARARLSRRITMPRARSSAARSISSLMSRMSFDMSLCQSRLTTASGASRRRIVVSIGVGALVESS